MSSSLMIMESDPTIFLLMFVVVVLLLIIIIIIIPYSSSSWGLTWEAPGLWASFGDSLAGWTSRRLHKEVSLVKFN